MMTLSYITDLTDDQWKLIEVFFPKPRYGRPRHYSLRRIVDAIFYVAKSGCQWRLLPTDFPPFKLVNYYYNRWSTEGRFEKMNRILSAEYRLEDDREPEPTIAIIDSQSVETGFNGNLGFDGHKKVKGVKRHILVDTLGLVLLAVVGRANEHDSKGAKPLLRKSVGKLFHLKVIFGDQAYRGEIVAWVTKNMTFDLENTSHRRDFRGNPSPLRWVVERTFAWLDGHRRLRIDDDRKSTSFENWIYVAMSRLLLLRLEPLK